MTDKHKGALLEKKADNVASILDAITIEQDKLDSRVAESKVNKLQLFIFDYVRANPNVLVSDLVRAMSSNGLPVEWIDHNLDQLLDSDTAIALIVCGGNYQEIEANDKQA